MGIPPILAASGPTYPRNNDGIAHRIIDNDMLFKAFNFDFNPTTHNSI